MIMKENGPAPNGHVLISDGDSSKRINKSNCQNNQRNLMPTVLVHHCPLLSFIDDGDIDEDDKCWNTACESTSEAVPGQTQRQWSSQLSHHQNKQRRPPTRHNNSHVLLSAKSSAKQKMECSQLLLPTTNVKPTSMAIINGLDPLNPSSLLWSTKCNTNAPRLHLPLPHLAASEQWSSDSVGEMSSQQTSTSSTSKSDKEVDHRTRGKRRLFFSPYTIWKRKFLRDYNSPSEDLWKQVLFAGLPHCVVFLLISAYIMFGTMLFRLCDDDLANLPFHDVLLFAFTTITTIGYGNIVPKTEASRVLCVLFCIVGIPLAFIALASAGEWLAEAYWVCVSALRRKKELVSDDEARLPLGVVICLILVHSLLGGLIFHFWIDEMPFVPAVYFSFISITTIGFGDLCPTPNDLFQTLVTIGYLSSGIVIMSTLFGTLSNQLRRLHYLGREFTGARNVQVWFGGTRLSIRELVHVVASQFEISPQRFQEVLYELDDLVRLAANHRTFEQTEAGNDSDDDHRQNHMPPSLLLNKHNRLSNDSETAQENITPGQLTYSSRFTDRNEQEQMIQALSTLYHLTLKGSCSFQSPSRTSALAALRLDTVVPPRERQISERSLPSIEHQIVLPPAKFSVIKIEDLKVQDKTGLENTEAIND